MANTNSSADILFEQRGSLGLVTLNRPKALNALTADMCRAMRQQLRQWEGDSSVCSVAVVSAGGKAFCAGGDVVRVSKSYQEGGDGWQRFFREEYRMNVAIDAFSKPYVALVDGICMGGGVGISLPGDFWVATETTLFAMPETGLGLFPDVGGSWFLPRLPGESGMYLALTGARLKAPDLFRLRIASHVCSSAAIPAITAALSTLVRPDVTAVQTILDQFHSAPGPAPIDDSMDAIDAAFSGSSVEAILAALDQAGDDWAAAQAASLRKKSPSSLLVTFEQVRRGRALKRFEDAMTMEFRMVHRSVAAADFHEGVRAILIDKDHAPRWRPQSLSDISADDVSGYFEPLGPGRELMD